MDPLKDIKPEWDSTVPLMIESQERGHAVFYIEPKDLFVRNSLAYAHCSLVDLNSAIQYTIKRRKTIKLDSFDAIIIRNDPPFDLDYLYMTYILDLVGSRTFIMNSPQGLRNLNEKFFVTHFKEFMAETLISKDSEIILDFLKKHKKIVSKELHGHGGHEVSLLQYKKPLQQLKNKIKKITRNDTEYIMVQEFIHDTLVGDKRIHILNGNILASIFKRTKKGEFRANLSYGGTIEPTTLTKKEKQLAAHIGKELVNQGIYFAGLDVVGERIIDINVTSPSFIPGTNKANGIRMEKDIIDFVEETCYSNKSK